MLNQSCSSKPDDSGGNNNNNDDARLFGNMLINQQAKLKLVSICIIIKRTCCAGEFLGNLFIALLSARFGHKPIAGITA